MFIPGKNNPLFALLGLGYGQMVFEGLRTMNVCTIDHADNFLKLATKEGIVDEEGAAKIKQQMLEANMAPNFSKICESIRNYTADEGFEPSFKFVAHEGCPYPLPHGDIVNKEDEPVSDPIYNLEDGLGVVLEMADSEQYHVLDCIDVFKQMLAMDLPVDETAARELIEALPKEKRDELKNPRMDAMLDMITDMLGGNVTIVEIVLPRRADQ